MATYTVKSALKPANSVGWSGQRMTAWGTVILADTRSTATTTTGPQSGDIYRLVRLPQGAVVVGGHLYASRFASGTSAASTTCQLNIGFSGAFKDTVDGTSWGATTASQALGALVPVDFSEASVGSIKGESGLNFALGGLLYSVGPLKLSEECWAQVKFSGSATSFISGSAITLGIDYYMGVHA
jgi:hypothetical protein